MTDALFDALVRSFRHPLWHDATDAELADEHRTTPRKVRAARARWRRELRLAEIVQLLEEAAEELGWKGTTADLLEIAVVALTDDGCRDLVDLFRGMAKERAARAGRAT